MIPKTFLFGLSWLLMIVVDIANAKDLALESDDNTQIVLYQNGRLFIQAKEISLNDLLVAVAKRTNTVLTAYIPLDESVTVNIHWYSIDEALKAILRDYSYIYANASSSVLWILPQNSNEEMATKSVSLNYPLEPIDSTTSLQLQVLSDDPEEREDALVDLARNDRHNAINSLTSAITDPDHRVRKAAVVTLTLVDESEAVNALSAALADQDPRIREEAVDALYEVGGEMAVSALQLALEDEVGYVRQAAMEALDELQK
jgi:hypothetical protein